MSKFGGYACVLLGMYVIFQSIFFHGASTPGVIFGLILFIGGLYLGLRAASAKPPLPAGFNASYWNKNIALDTTTGALWVRDAGQTAVLQRQDIVGWEMQNTNFNSAAVIGPRITPIDNRLLIKTRHLDRPMWTVKFNASSSLSGAGNHQNHKELKVWYERLNAFYNHTAA